MLMLMLRTRKTGMRMRVRVREMVRSRWHGMTSGGPGDSETIEVSG
jgi:hypothetical protein